MRWASLGPRGQGGGVSERGSSGDCLQIGGGAVIIDGDKNGDNVVDTVDGVGGDDSVVLERGGDDVDGDAIGNWGGGDVRGAGEDDVRLVLV